MLDPEYLDLAETPVKKIEKIDFPKIKLARPGARLALKLFVHRINFAKVMTFLQPT